MVISKRDENGNCIITEEGNTVNDWIISQISFNGKNNIVVVEKNVNMINSRILFEGEGNVVYLSSSVHPYLLNITLYNDSVFYIGKNNYINGKINAILSEQKHLIIGNDGLFSFGIWIRLADPHLIYDIKTRKRNNLSRSVFLGDHVWVGQGAMILKGTQVGSGGIIGAMALVSGKKVPSNTVWAGNPAKQVKEDIFYTGKCVHRYRKEQTEQSMLYEQDEYIFSADGCMRMEEIDEALTRCNSSDERLQYLLDKIVLNNNKNRFFIKKLSGKTKSWFRCR